MADQRRRVCGDDRGGYSGFIYGVHRLVNGRVYPRTGQFKAPLCTIGAGLVSEVFISHASVDDAFVTELRRRLEGVGVGGFSWFAGW